MSMNKGNFFLTETKSTAQLKNGPEALHLVGIRSNTQPSPSKTDRPKVTVLPAENPKVHELAKKYMQTTLNIDLDSKEVKSAFAAMGIRPEELRVR